MIECNAFIISAKIHNCIAGLKWLIKSPYNISNPYFRFINFFFYIRPIRINCAMPFQTFSILFNLIGEKEKKFVKAFKIGRIFLHWDLPPNVMPLVANTTQGLLYWREIESDHPDGLREMMNSWLLGLWTMRGILKSTPRG